MHNLIKLLKLGYQLILGWLIIYPLSLLIKKQENLITLIGRDNGRFTDNVKYLFLYLHKLRNEEIEYYFITEDKSTYHELKQNDLPVLYYPSFQSVYKLLRTHILIIDNWNWILNLKYFFLHKAIKYQIWHGIPLKKIEFDHEFRINLISFYLMKIRDTLGFRYPNYDYLISTSEIISNISFKNAFRSENIIVTGYPRNDSFFNNTTDNILIGTDRKSYYHILELKKTNHKLIVYTPTFRDTGGNIISDSGINLESLSQFASKNRLIFIFKFHPFPNYDQDINTYENILIYDSHKDIYPVLKISDILITDYSSTYFDYLLMDKPIIFFPFDLDKYLKEDRDMYFAYNDITPGTKVSNQSELESEIIRILKEKIDSHKAHRSKVLNQVFFYKDENASERIWNNIKMNYIDNEN